MRLFEKYNQPSIAPAATELIGLLFHSHFCSPLGVCTSLRNKFTPCAFQVLSKPFALVTSTFTCDSLKHRMECYSHASLRDTDTTSSLASSIRVSSDHSSIPRTQNYPLESKPSHQVPLELSHYFLFFCGLVLPPHGNDNNNSEIMHFEGSVCARLWMLSLPYLI